MKIWAIENLTLGHIKWDGIWMQGQKLNIFLKWIFKLLNLGLTKQHYRQHKQ